MRERKNGKICLKGTVQGVWGHPPKEGRAGIAAHF